jgi:hypothetical protein
LLLGTYTLCRVSELEEPHHNPNANYAHSFFVISSYCKADYKEPWHFRPYNIGQECKDMSNVPHPLIYAQIPILLPFHLVWSVALAKAERAGEVLDEVLLFLDS